MSPLQANHPAPVAAEQTLPSGEQIRETTKSLQTKDWTCLVLSLDSSRRDKLRSTVQFSGWRPLACASVAEAIQYDERWHTQFALVDLAPDSEGQQESVFRFVERLSERPNPLVMVCDDTPTSEAEVWARKLGVWLYLPEPQIGEELAELCSEAMRISRSRANDASVNAGV